MILGLTRERLVGQQIIRLFSSTRRNTKRSDVAIVINKSSGNYRGSKNNILWQALSTNTSAPYLTAIATDTGNKIGKSMAPRYRYSNNEDALRDETLLLQQQLSNRNQGKNLVGRRPYGGRNQGRNGYSTVSRNMSTTTKSTGLKAWPVDVVESHGDYRAEAWLEEHIGGPLYRYQKTLPKLPIPTIDETMKRLVPTMMPLIEETPKHLNELNDAVSKFPIQASNLQERLKERASGEYSNSSYLQHWWNTLGYLSVRDSVVINVSYFFHLADDKTLPPNIPRNVSRAASILYAVGEYRYQVCSGEMKQETIGRPPKETPICSTAFKYMFNACRIPHREMDSYKIYDPSKHTHVIIARHDRFYRMDFVHPTTHEPLPLEQLQSGLLKVIEMASSSSKDESNYVLPIGILTSQDRNSWADAREELLAVGGITASDAFKEFESGSLLICLDDATPTSRTECGKQFLYGGHVESAHANNKKLFSYNNRYYDKSIQIFVQENGKVGMLGEHSMMDGMPLVGLANHICSSTYNKVMTKQESTGDSDASSPIVKEIFQKCQPLWSSSPQLQQMIDQASNKHKQIMDDQSLNVQAFMGYGSSKIKQMGYSPDAFVQMAIQLATYRLWNGQQGATYEATQTRPFLHGRTETTRSVSPASANFCNIMGDFSSSDISDAEKVVALQKAVQSHVAYIKDAAKGYGVDRHLLGLALLVKENETSPDLFGHPIYTKAKTWRVSTSHLSHPKFDNWGFGQVVPHGVGVGYGILPQKIVFNVTALKEHGWTSKLSHLLEEALMEMAALHDETKGSNDAPLIKSKL